MKLLVTAANGQLGTDVVRFFKNKHEVIAYLDTELDITDKDKVAKAVNKHKPDFIINTAAYTNVDACEDNADLAFSVNAEGAGILAMAAESIGAGIVHISTDYVFDGEKQTPYTEKDKPNPVSIYGKSKLKGEELVASICPKHFILRTAWLYGKNGNNFVKTMLKLAETRQEIDVVTDQRGNPTSTNELIRIMDALLKTDKYGIYHATTTGECTWNTFAKKIFELNNISIMVNDVTSEQFVRKAKRPKNSSLSKKKLIGATGYTPKHWEDALKEYFERAD